MWYTEVGGTYILKTAYEGSLFSLLLTEKQKKSKSFIHLNSAATLYMSTLMYTTQRFADHFDLILVFWKDDKEPEEVEEGRSKSSNKS